MPEENLLFWWLGLATLAGLLIGSFLNVVIHRLPLMLENADAEDADGKTKPTLSLLFPASHCPHCKTPLNIGHNIPVISYVLLRGRCGFCDAAISPRYPLVEIIAMLAAIIVALKLGPTTQTLAGIALSWALIALVFIDIENKILPDEITLPLIWAGLLLSTTGLFTTPSMAITGAVAGYGVFWLINRSCALVSGKEGMGYGDMKLLAACGAWFGWQALPFIVLVASLSGLVVSLLMILSRKLKRGEKIPFGPYLCLAYWLYLLLNEEPIYRIIYPF